MDPLTRPLRSALYIPASNARAMEKAASLPVDAIIFDLEDAVAPSAKAEARAHLAEALTRHDYGARVKLLRINGFDTEYSHADLSAVAQMRADAVLLPKVNGADDVARLGVALSNSEMAIWAMMETPLGILNAAQIAFAPRMQGFVLGTNDLAKELGSRNRPDRMAMQTSLQLALLAAKAAGIVAIDGVYNAFKDQDGLRRECEDGRDMGFDGKSLIHPAQVATANAIFGPSDEEVDLARRQIEAFRAAKTEGKGVAVVDGKIVENLHVATAEVTLAKASAIAAMETVQ